MQRGVAAALLPSFSGLPKAEIRSSGPYGGVDPERHDEYAFRPAAFGVPAEVHELATAIPSSSFLTVDSPLTLASARKRLGVQETVSSTRKNEPPPVVSLRRNRSHEELAAVGSTLGTVPRSTLSGGSGVHPAGDGNIGCVK